MTKAATNAISIEPSPNSWRENLFLSEEMIVERYNMEKKLNQLVLMGDYEGVLSLLESFPRGPEYFLDFEARSKDEVERARMLATIMNTGLRVQIVNTGIPVNIIHGTATYFGRVINQADADTLFSGRLMDAIIKTYCKMMLEFGRKSYSPVAEKIVNYIVSNIAGELSLQQIADRFNYSPAYVNRILKRETGYSAIQFIKQKRVALAKTLLELNELSVEAVSEAVGYANFTYFCRVFRQVEAMSPTAYREKALRERNVEAHG